jgi:hypothetical protein
VVDPLSVEKWVRVHAEPAGTVETVHERPWAKVLRVPLADGVAWFKACSPVQAFEPRLTAELFARWPDRVAEVLGYDEERGWLLLADAGMPVDVFGNPVGCQNSGRRRRKTAIYRRNAIYAPYGVVRHSGTALLSDHPA